MIKGETVILLEQTKSGVDPFGQPVVEVQEVPVEGVLVGTPSTDDATTEWNMTGKRILFVLGIPKGDTHDWKDKTVVIRGQKFKTYGFPLTQLDANTPTRWNTQVKVEAYE